MAVASLGQEARKQQPATPGPVKDEWWDRMVKTSKVRGFQRDLSIYETKCVYTMNMIKPTCEVSSDKWILKPSSLKVPKKIVSNSKHIWKWSHLVTSTPGDELSRSQPQKDHHQHQVTALTSTSALQVPYTMIGHETPCHWSFSNLVRW